MPEPTETTELSANRGAEPSADQGGKQVRAVMISLIGLVVLAAVLGGTPLMGAIFWAGVFVFLWLSINAGRGWARWVVIGLAAILAAGNGWQAAQLFGADGLEWTINVGQIVVLGWCAFVLALSPKVQAFLAARRAAARSGDGRGSHKQGS